MIPTIIRDLAVKIKAKGGRLYITGGCVRDILLKQTPTDWDCEVFGMHPEQFCTFLRNERHPYKEVGESFGIYKITHPHLDIDIGIPRLERKVGPKHTDCEIVTDPNMSIEQAAKRRDFTMNAIYIDPEEGQTIDPLGGVDDLKKSLMRHSSKAFSEDPLRVLRGMQFMARYRLTAHPATIKLCSVLSPTAIANERVFWEWKKLILKGVKPSLGLNFLYQAGWLRYFPTLEAMCHTPQDPIWHPEGNVWEHTLIAMDAFARERQGSSTEELIIGFGVLLHDCGKPYCSDKDESGRIHAYRHSDLGLAPAMHFMQSMTNRNDLIHSVLKMVKYHMIPPALYLKGKDKTIRRLSTKTCLNQLIRVAKADYFATGCHADKDPLWVDWLIKRAASLGVEQNKPSPIIRGRDLLNLSMHPGPDMGKMLSQIYEAQLDGKIIDFASGMELANTMVCAYKGLT